MENATLNQASHILGLFEPYSLEHVQAAIESGLTRLNGELGSLLGVVEGADALPASQVVEAIADRARALEEVLARWQKLKA